MPVILLAMRLVERYPRLRVVPLLGLAHALHEGCEALSEEHPELMNESLHSKPEVYPLGVGLPPRLFREQ